MSYPSISSRVDDVREKIANACARVGRSADDVTIVAVTKTHPETAVLAVRDAGLTDVGENRVQEMEEKLESLGRLGLRWHLIGHLQRNKVRKAIEIADLIHSVDSLRLARKISEEAVASGRTVEALVQVNVAGEETKGGLSQDAALDEIGAICALPGLRIVGLMSMAPFVDDEAIVRPIFSRTRELLDRAVKLDGFQGRELSMGMSGDFEVAVQEGSTLVRLGTVLLGARTP